MRKRTMQLPATGPLIGLLDIGTSKVVCLIVTPVSDAPMGSGAGALRVVGFGHQRSRGIKAGVVVDLDAAEQAVRAAVTQAERSAGRMLEEVHIAVACGRLTSNHFTARTQVQASVVGADDIARVDAAGRSYAGRGNRTLLHLNPTGYRLDGMEVRDPIGLAGDLLSADLHAVTADETPIRNLLLLVERCYLAPASIAPSPYVAALAATTEEERRLGVIVADIGAGTSGIAVFADGNLVGVDAIPVGGNHITFDIARALATPVPEAERIKTLYGTLLRAQSDIHDIVSYPLAGEEEPTLHQTSKAEVHDIICPRVASTLELIDERIVRMGLARQSLERVVLTGGASQLVGMGEFAAEVFGRPVRIGRPHGAEERDEVLESPAFAAVFGLAQAALAPAPSQIEAGRAQAAAGYFGRMGQWIRQSF